MTAWIDELERDLGPAARLRLIANAGGRYRNVPQLGHAAASKLATEVGADVVTWLAERFGGTCVHFPSPRGRETERRAALLRAAILDAGLTNPKRSANDIAGEFGVSAHWVHKLRGRMQKEYGVEPLLPLWDTL